MSSNCITFQNSGYFTPLIVDYLNQDKEIQSYYHRFPTIANFEDQITEKTNNYGSVNRSVLVDALTKQNENFPISAATQANIQSLALPHTFTITTGHQLNLFTGPLYFIYKIVSVLNLCKDLKKEYPDFNFVPVYWMATEDHDFEEINHFKLKGETIRWDKVSKGPVGRLSTEGLDEVFEKMQIALGNSDYAKHLKSLFEKAYLGHKNLADATRYLVNELFKVQGLVIIDGDDPTLKQQFIPLLKEELLQQTSCKKVSESLQTFPYEAQVNPREINLFYIDNDLRERILFEDGVYKVNHTNLVFSVAEMLSLVESTPEKFSPNVILRPLYQEILLPNLCYIGGGGEIAYWLELKNMFEAFEVTFPMLALRNSVVVASEKEQKKTANLQLTWNELFLKQSALVNHKTKQFSTFTIDFGPQKEYLKQQFEELLAIAAKTDKTFVGAVKAQQVKQIKGLANLEKRLLKAEKRNHEDQLNRIVALQNALFPNKSLQERQLNFTEFYLEYGENFMATLLKELQPLSNQFNIITL